MKFKQALLHNTSWKMLALLFTFLNNILIVRILGVEASAVFFYAIAIFILFSTILKFGLENGIVYVLSKNSQSIKSVSYFLLLFFVAQTFITAVILKYFIKEIQGFTFYWVLVYVLSNIMLYYVNAYYQVKKMFISLNVLSAVTVIIQTFLLMTIYFCDKSFFVTLGITKSKIDVVLIISAGTIFLQIILLILFFYTTNKNDFIVPYSKDSSIKKLFSYSILNFIITVLFFLVLRTDLYFVEKYCTKVGLANYLQAAKIGQLLLIFPGLIAGVIFPYTINDSKALAGKVAYLCRGLTFLYLIIFLVFLGFGKFVFPWMLGKDFNLMYEIFAISFVGVYCLSISLLIISYFEGTNKQKIIIWSFLSVLFVVVIADYFLVHKYGYTGAAAIFYIANLSGLAILFNTFKKETEINFTDMFIVKQTDFNLLN